MKKNELFKLLDSVVEENDTVSAKKYDRVLLIDGLNLFFRNFAMMNIVNRYFLRLQIMHQTDLLCLL